MENNNLPQQAIETKSLKDLLKDVNVKGRFQEILGKKAPAFMSSIISVTSQNSLLKKADANTVLSAAAIAATLDLPINPSLGMAYIVPYENKRERKHEAQFQIGYKGIIQLAIRSGLYHRIEVNEVYEGELEVENRFTGEFSFGKRTSDTVTGYLAYFKLTTGFEKMLYMTKKEAEAHGKKYSATFRNDKGLWVTDFDAMAKKTVLKQLLSKFGIMSIDMQRAQVFDQSVTKDAVYKDNIEETNINYADNNQDKASLFADIADAEITE